MITRLCGCSILIGVLLCVHARPSAAESVIPPDRLVDWRPGVQARLSAPEAGERIRLTPDALKGPDAAKPIQQAIDRIGKSGVVLLPPGEFTLRTGVRLRSGVVLRGSGPDRTHLTVDLSERRTVGAISFKGETQGRDFALSGGFETGSTRLEPSGPAPLTKGQTIIVYSENDPEVMFTDRRWDVVWARQTVGQIVRVEEVTDKGIRIDVPLRLSYRKELRPRIRVLQPIENAGVEDLHIRRRDRLEDAIISIWKAVNCHVRNVHAEHCMRAHVWIVDSRFITVEGCYFHHAHDYGGGGHGYGVVAGKRTTDCLVTNNIFEHLRHAMMVKEGANGNVFSYNYSFDNVRLTDISIHGHYSYMNLFEGNVVQFVLYADHWGPTGPLTTCFRNRIATRLAVRDHSHRANIVGNVLLGGDVEVHDTCRDAFVAANLVGGKWAAGKASPGSRLRASVYLKEKPSFWGNRPWPGIGADVDRSGTGTPLPAEDRYRRMLGKTDAKTMNKEGQHD